MFGVIKASKSKLQRNRWSRATSERGSSARRKLKKHDRYVRLVDVAS